MSGEMPSPPTMNDPRSYKEKERQMNANASTAKAGTMRIERFFVPGLAQVSYLVVSGNEAVVVDPERNVDGSWVVRMRLAKQNGKAGTCPREWLGI